MTEHSVTYDVVGGTRQITRQVFEAGTRILGSERTELRVWRGYAGWKVTSWDSDTRQFRTRKEASAWLDEMFCEWELAQVRARGGTKLVIAT